jgi:hypothetical protein
MTESEPSPDDRIYLVLANAPQGVRAVIIRLMAEVRMARVYKVLHRLGAVKRQERQETADGKSRLVTLYSLPLESPEAASRAEQPASQTPLSPDGEAA